MSEQQNPRIDEINMKAFLRLVIFATILNGLAPGALFFIQQRQLVPLDLPAGIYILFGVGICASAFLLFRLITCRVRIDENGVEVGNLMGSPTCFRWDEIRTAAVVRLTTGAGKPQPIIVLATRPAASVLTRAALIDDAFQRQLRRDEHVRIDLTPARRAAVERYLHMQMPDIRL